MKVKFQTAGRRTDYNGVEIAESYYHGMFLPENLLHGEFVKDGKSENTYSDSYWVISVQKKIFDYEIKYTYLDHCQSSSRDVPTIVDHARRRRIYLNQGDKFEDIDNDNGILERYQLEGILYANYSRWTLNGAILAFMIPDED